ncbi:FeoA family protein [Leptospira sp. 'Mane']|uniref:FeoA family protein n=1 Tax=Leptospira sp. 'Mane' TaxID=3387407 RepID=UPI00398A5509
MTKDFYVLSDLAKDTQGEIIEMKRESISDSFITELLELGLFPGANFKILDKMESLGKIVVLANGTKVGLRLSDCKSVLVKISKPNS